MRPMPFGRVGLRRGLALLLAVTSIAVACGSGDGADRAADAVTADNDLTLLVVDPTGQPVVGAMVALEDVVGAPVATGTDGRAAWRGLARSAVTVTAEADDFLPGRAELTLRAGVNDATLTLIPVPYELTLVVTDLDGVPVAGALVTVAAADVDPAVTDHDGEVRFVVPDLIDGEAPVRVVAQGYRSVAPELLLRRGPNDVTLALEADPHAVSEALACGVGEQVLYLEDFQDGRLAGWGDLDARLAEGDEAVTVGTDLAAPGDVALVVGPTEAGATVAAEYTTATFGDAVFRVRVRIDAEMAAAATTSLRWHSIPGPPAAAYEIGLGIGGVTVERAVGDGRPPVTLLSVPDTRLADGTFHDIEVATVAEAVEVRIDGATVGRAADPDPLADGRLGLAVTVPPGRGSVAVDDIRVCGPATPR